MSCDIKDLHNSRLLEVMSPPVATAAVKLDYPLWAADFDPYTNGLLLVGGGGGEGRSGVKNKIVRCDLDYWWSH